MSPVISAFDEGSDEEIFSVKKPTRKKFVDSDEESVLPAILTNALQCDSDQDVSLDVCSNDDNSGTHRRKRRVIKFNDSDSDDDGTGKENSSSSLLFNKLNKDKKEKKEKPKKKHGFLVEKNEDRTESSQNGGESHSVLSVSKKSSASKLLKNAEISQHSIPSDLEESAIRLTVVSPLPNSNSEVANSAASPMALGNKMKLLFADKSLYDAESSEEEDRQGANFAHSYDAEGSGDEVAHHHPKEKQRNEKGKKKQTGKKGMNEMDHILSETQRLVRQSRVSLPYHKPRQRTLAEFLQRRPSMSSSATPVRMSVEQLAVMEKQLKQRAKQAEEFYKSSSDEEQTVQGSSENGRKDDNEPSNKEVAKEEETKGTNQEQSEASVTGSQVPSCEKPEEGVQGIEPSGPPLAKNAEDKMDVVEETTVFGAPSIKLKEQEGRNDVMDTNETMLPFRRKLFNSAEENGNRSSIGFLPSLEVNKSEIPQKDDESHISICSGSAMFFADKGFTRANADEETVFPPDRNVLESGINTKCSTGQQTEGQSQEEESARSLWCLGENLLAPFFKKNKCGDTNGESLEEGPCEVDTQDMVLRFTETNDILNSDTVSAAGGDNKCTDKSNADKGIHFSFKKNLSDLLWKDGWNNLKNPETENMKEVSNAEGLNLEKLKANDTESPSIMLEGEDARSVCLEAFKDTSSMIEDSSSSKFNINHVQVNDMESPRMMLEGENARSMCLERSAAAESSESKDTLNGNIHHGRESQKVMMDDENAVSAMEHNRAPEDMVNTSGESIDNCTDVEKDVNKTEGENNSQKVIMEDENAVSAMEASSKREDIVNTSAEDIEISAVIEKDVNNVECELVDDVGRESNNERKMRKSDSVEGRKPEASKRISEETVLFTKLLRGQDIVKDREGSKKPHGKMAPPIVPHLTGSPNKMIDLDATPSPRGILTLMSRFLKHAGIKRPKTQATDVELSIVTAEQNKSGFPELKKDSVKVHLTGDDSPQPGAKLQQLKKQLAQQMAQRREQEWSKRVQECQAETELEPDEKSDCGLFDEEEELEEEMSTSSESEEEEEEEVLEKRPEKTRIRSAFLDDEAEVSDEEDVSSDEDEEDDLGVHPDTGKRSQQATSDASNKLQRTATLDLFASHEDNDDSDAQSPLDDQDSMTIPPYQPGGALTQSIETVVEEVVPPVITPTLPTPLMDSKLQEMSDSNDGMSEAYTEETPPSLPFLQLCSGGGDPDSQDTREIENELLGLCSGKFLTQPVEPSQDEEQTQKDSLFLQETQASQAPVDNISTQEVPHRRSVYVLASSDEEDFSLQEKRSKRRHRKMMNFIDEDSDDDSFKKCASEGEENVVEYDSEENEVEVDTVLDKPRSARDFFDEEAELSESEWGSADEDERDLDKLEREEGDDENLDEEKLKEQLDKIHMRRLLDDDQKDVRRLKELLFEDGELHSEGGGRQRQFRWKNLNNMEEFLASGNLSDEEGLAETYGADDGEDEQDWRRMRFEREKFLQEHREKLSAETKDIVLEENVKLRLVTAQSSQCKAGSVKKQQQTKRGSFLARSKEALARIAQLTRAPNETPLLGPVNSRNFVFATLSPEKKEEEKHKKSLKRKADSEALASHKKPCLKPSILDHLEY